MNHGEWLRENTPLCLVYNQNRETQGGAASLYWVLFLARASGPPQHLYPLRSGPLWCISSPELPLAVGSVLMTKQSRTGVTPRCPGKRYIYRGQAWQTGRQLSGFNMAKVTDQSWEPKTTSTKRWKKRKTLSQPGSRGKVVKIYKKVKRPLHVCSRKNYSPKVITTRRQKRTRRAKLQPVP